MRFADPHACPSCRGTIAGQTVCPHCGLDLASPEVRQLWQTLLIADDLLARATQRRQAPVPPQPAARDTRGAPAAPQAAQRSSVAGEPQSYPSLFAPPQAATAPARQRQWSVGTILLALGALGLIVAGFIFVTRSWGDLGLVGRTLVLMGVTVVFAGLGVWVTRRPLRASAEAVWSIVLALLTLDFFAARHEGMIGLDGVDVAWAWVIWGVVLVGLGVLVAGLSRPWVKADLVAPAIAGGLGIAMAGIGAGAAGDEWELAWRSIVALVVAGILALATRPAGLRPLTLIARIVVAGFFAWALVTAAIELLDHPSLHEVVAEGHGGPLAVMTVASLVVGWVVKQVRVPAVAIAVIAASVLVATPASDRWQPDGIVAAVAVLSALLSAVAWRGTNDWMRGVRAGTAPAVIALVAVHLGLVGDVLDACGTALDSSWTGAWDTRLDPGWAGDLTPWVVPLPALALIVTAWFVPRWPEIDLSEQRRRSILAVAAGVAVVNGVVAAHPPVWAAVATIIAAAIVLAAVDLRRVCFLAGPTSAVLVVVAVTLAATDQGVSAAAWPFGTLVLAALAASAAPVLLRQAYAVVAVGLLVAGLAAIADLLDPPHSVPPLVAVIAGLALLTAAGTVWRELPVRVPVEVAAALATFVPLVADGSTAELAVRWTIAGVWLVSLSVVVAGRRFYVWPGIGALVVAYILLIVDSGFSFVEAYTLPLGATALAVGLYVARKQPTANTWLVLGPGLAIALLPSVPQALADPTDLRALLLGLGALVALALGIRLGWQAPFVSGAVIVGLLVLFNVGPYANAAPRVVLIAAVSVVLLAVGITWEDRVRDGRKLIGYVRSMR